MATATQTFKNFIDGESVDAAEGQTDAVLNPATGEEIAQAASSTQEDVERAVKAARAAFDGGWSTSTPGERALAILKLADALEERASDHDGAFKVQVAGPWTLAATVERPRGDKMLADHGARQERADRRDQSRPVVAAQQQPADVLGR